MWVALAARLGAGSSTQPLQLRGAAGLLTLRDAAGQRWQAPGFSLSWQRVPLPQPLQIRRLVAGPFASFESAERQADQWRRLGVPVTLAQPGDWEVWAPPGSPVPSGWTVRSVEQRHSTAVEPVLQLPGRPPQRLAGPLTLEAPGGLRWQGGVYAGPFRLQGDAHGSWSLVEQVPLERYLEGVLPHEIGADAPPQALAAQAVLARTWSLRNQHRYAADGYHLCVTTQCQVYSDPRVAGAPVREAIGRTRGLVLSWQDQPIHAVYHASNGGVAAGLDEAWNAEPQLYLRPALDRADAPADAAPLPPVSELALLLRRTQGFVGADHPRFRWSRWLERQQIAEALARQGLQLGQVQRLTVLERGPSGRVTALAITGSSGRTVLRVDAIRRTLRSLPSTLFVVTPEGPDRWLVQGGGFGHGVGLSQAGAIDLGRRGWSFSRILERYYPGTRLGPLPPPPPPALGGDP
jgi:SpoIID/LytB domain protein